MGKSDVRDVSEYGIRNYKYYYISIFRCQRSIDSKSYRNGKKFITKN